MTHSKVGEGGNSQQTVERRSAPIEIQYIHSSVYRVDGSQVLDEGHIVLGVAT